MELTNSVIKDIGEIYSRLFDHRPVLHGEIAYFVREFEEKRKYREEARLNKILEHQQEIIDKSLPRSKEGLGEQLLSLSAKVTVATEMCGRIIENEEARLKVDQLAEQRQQRVTEWSRFMTEMYEKSAKVDEDFEHDLDALKKQYEELENNLRITPITP